MVDIQNEITEYGIPWENVLKLYACNLVLSGPKQTAMNILQDAEGDMKIGNTDKAKLLINRAERFLDMVN